jgi:hypothetical protein
MQQAMSEVGSTPLLALLLAYQPQELPLEQLAAAAAAAGQDEQRQQQQQQLAKQVLNLPFDAAAVANSQEISWICIDSSKPVSEQISSQLTLLYAALVRLCCLFKHQLDMH